MIIEYLFENNIPFHNFLDDIDKSKLGILCITSTNYLSKEFWEKNLKKKYPIENILQKSEYIRFTINSNHKITVENKISNNLYKHMSVYGLN